jgi:muconolactone delta-isomerase
MWPRTMEERNRRRNTGFVCFMNRDDAEEALEACDETDTFNNGRQLMMRWGKNVKKVRRETKTDEPKKKELVEKLNEVSASNSSSGSLPKDVSAGEFTGRSIATNTFERQQDQTLGDPFQAKPYELEIHASRAIRVEIPTDQSRFHFISTTASYISKDPELEQILKDTEMGNSLFSFLTLDSDDDNDLKEKMFYRWRVYSFCQGDTHSIWRTEPVSFNFWLYCCMYLFGTNDDSYILTSLSITHLSYIISCIQYFAFVYIQFIMFSHESARYWIPPPMDMEAVNREKANAKEKEDRLRQQKEDRANRELMTGRQFEREFSRKRRGEFGAKDSKLDPDELSQFDQIVRKELSISRETICRAMAFCFDKCFAAQDISGLLMQVLLDESDSVTNDMRIARLYLLSDVLFNSQQPGVRNAFMYRSTIESLAPEIFRKLGVVVKSKERSSGRITVNKLRKAVSAVLGAWTEWGVFDAAFMDELDDHFEGREVKSYNKDKNEIDINANDSEEQQYKDVVVEEEEIVIHEARGDWKEVSNEVDDDENDTGERIVVAMATTKKPDISETKKKRRKQNPAVNEPGKVPKSNNEEIDGKYASSDVDGEALDGEELDGEALDGEALDDEAIYGDDVDGEDLDGEALDGDAFDSDEMT